MLGAGLTLRRRGFGDGKLEEGELCRVGLPVER